MPSSLVIEPGSAVVAIPGIEAFTQICTFKDITLIFQRVALLTGIVTERANIVLAGSTVKHSSLLWVVFSKFCSANIAKVIWTEYFIIIEKD